MSNIKLSNITIGNAGERYVAAELERRNYTTAIVGNNCKDYDVMAKHNETHKDILIQVKACQNEKKRWLVGKNPIVMDNLYYILVCLNDNKEDNNPTYYILPSREAVKLKEENHKKYCEKHGYDINDKNYSMREIILEDELVNKYKNNWDILK